MEYNVCGTCGAKDGRAGLLINGDCMNCYETKKQNKVVISLNLPRTDEEIQKTLKILDNN